MNLIRLVLVFVLMVPAFAPLLSHDAVHALHDHQARHHGEQQAHEHHGGHAAPDHAQQDEQQSARYSNHFDAATYFSDYLHVDLQNPAKVLLKAPVLDAQDFDHPVPAVLNLMPRYAYASVQSRAPPDMRISLSGKTPVYLSTQRLRI